MDETLNINLNHLIVPDDGQTELQIKGGYTPNQMRIDRSHNIIFDKDEEDSNSSSKKSRSRKRKKSLEPNQNDINSSFVIGLKKQAANMAQIAEIFSQDDLEEYENQSPQNLGKQKNFTPYYKEQMSFGQEGDLLAMSR